MPRWRIRAAITAATGEQLYECDAETKQDAIDMCIRGEAEFIEECVEVETTEISENDVEEIEDDE